MYILKARTDVSTFDTFLEERPEFKAYQSTVIGRTLVPRKGSLQPADYSRLVVDVSNRRMDDLQGQVSDALEVLSKYGYTIAVLRMTHDLISINLEFLYEQDFDGLPPPHAGKHSSTRSCSGLPPGWGWGSASVTGSGATRKVSPAVVAFKLRTILQFVSFNLGLYVEVFAGSWEL